MYFGHTNYLVEAYRRVLKYKEIRILTRIYFSTISQKSRRSNSRSLTDPRPSRTLLFSKQFSRVTELCTSYRRFTYTEYYSNIIETGTEDRAFTVDRWFTDLRRFLDWLRMARKRITEGREKERPLRRGSAPCINRRSELRWNNLARSIWKPQYFPTFTCDVAKLCVIIRAERCI